METKVLPVFEWEKTDLNRKTLVKKNCYLKTTKTIGKKLNNIFKSIKTVSSRYLQVV